MQNAQNDTTTTAATTATTTDAPMLAELLATRAAELEEQQREETRREIQAREQARADALAVADDYMRAHFSPALADALRMTPAVDENALQRYWSEDEAEGAEYLSGPSYLMLDLSGADVDKHPETQDDGDDARADPSCDEGRDERWSLRYDGARYYGPRWTLHGPNGYRATVDAPYYKAPMDGVLLDAIAAYPAWLAGAEQRAEQRAEAQRRKQAEQQAEQEREERRKRERPRHFQSIDGVSLDNGGPILRGGNHLMITTLDRRGEDGIMDYSGVLESFTAVWLLLTLDGGPSPRAERAQRLIPVARVLAVRPLADVLAGSEDEETTAAD